MGQLENIEAVEGRLWKAADTLRANSGYASNEYFLPVMGLMFLRHAYSRYLEVKDGIVAGLPTRGGKRRAVTKADFSKKSAIYLKPEAQFDHLVDLPDSADRARAIIAAMESIEADHTHLRGILPKNEYQKLSNDVLGQLLRTLNPDELKSISGDIFGRIYEYFLTQFADQKAHDGGEFFTPVSLVSLIAHVLDPEKGIVLDPACGSGGMFVQSARTVEEHRQNPAERLTFRGLEKNESTIRLAKMNLAVHGLEGDIKEAITYYADPHELVGRADYVMANPPFNVDEIDADKVKRDPRLPFGLPGVNKEDKVSNGNYVWISYFYSYLNKKGRAGFVMSSQASGAGGREAKVRQKLVETGDVEAMIAIRSNFFYTRTVPCELWFLNRGKPEDKKDEVLMIDARSIYREVTRKIYDFSPEQQKNLLAIVWLYRRENDRFVSLLREYLERTVKESGDCFGREIENEIAGAPLSAFIGVATSLTNILSPFLDDLPADTLGEFNKSLKGFQRDAEQFEKLANAAAKRKLPDTNAGLKLLFEQLESLADLSRELGKQADSVHKLAVNLIGVCENDLNAKSVNGWNSREVAREVKAADKAREQLNEQLERVRYFRNQAQWLIERFPEAKLRNVEGLVKVVSRAEIEANDWSLAPGRYVGVAPDEEDGDFDFEETMSEIHEELDILNAEAVKLAKVIKRNFEGLAW